jgi:hypothetical protein
MKVPIHGERSRRPFGLWIVAVGHTLFAIHSILSVLPALHAPPPHGWSPTAAVWAPYLIAIMTATIILAWAVWAGFRSARIFLIITLAIAVCLYIPDILFIVPHLIESAIQDPTQWTSISFWWGLTFGLWLVFWVALEAWYLFSARTRFFYFPAIPTFRTHG